MNECRAARAPGPWSCRAEAGLCGLPPAHPSSLPSSPLFRLKKLLKCHIPDPSEFFSQLSSEHGGDFQVGVWRQRTGLAAPPAGQPVGGGAHFVGRECKNSGVCTPREGM